jgi:hypothetical protein
MANYDLLEKRDPQKYEVLKAEWEPKKEYIEKDLWVIRNFLSQEELNWINHEANDSSGWYPTMRSPYGNNTRNKFLGLIPQYGEDGILIPPHPSINPQWNPDIRDKTRLIEERLEVVLPKYFAGAGALQSFFEVPDEQIIAELGWNADYAMGWHYERDDEDSEEDQHAIVSGLTNKEPIMAQTVISASFNIYLNDNFNGGILEFKNKSYSIKPEPGMLINVPMSKEFEHRVTKVTNGNRHTVYGRCWKDIDKSFLSTREDC